MDGVSVAASIFSILGFAATSLQAIRAIKELCDENSPDEINNFVNDIDICAGVIYDVQELCRKIDATTPRDQAQRQRPSLRLGSLRRLVENCTSDLETCSQEASKRLNRQGHGSRRGLSSTVRQIRSFLSVVSQASRTKCQGRFSFHYEKIRAMLQTFAAQYNFYLAEKLDNIESKVTEIAEKESETQSLIELMERLSSSGSSNLALSRSTAARLEDFGRDIQAVRELCVITLSAYSTKSGSESDRRSSVRQMLNDFESVRGDHQTQDESHQNESEFSGQILDRSLVSPMRSHEPSEQPSPQLIRRSSTLSITSSHAPVMEPEFDALDEAIESFKVSLQEMQYPLIAEYLAVGHAWHTLVLQLSLLKVNLRPQNALWKEDKTKTFELLKTAKPKLVAQLASLRKSCWKEGIHALLTIVDQLPGTIDPDNDEWIAIAGHRYLDSSALFSMLPHFRSPNQRRQDKLNDINEWMLQILFSFSYLRRIARRFLKLYRQRIAETREARSISRDPQHRVEHVFEYDHHVERLNVILQNGELWRIEIEDSWFLDHAGRDETGLDYAMSATSASIPSLDSDTTAIQRTDDNEDTVNVRSSTRPSSPEIQVPGVRMTSDDIPSLIPKKGDEDFFLNEFPPQVPLDASSREIEAASKARRSAERALERYEKEECAWGERELAVEQYHHL